MTEYLVRWEINVQAESPIKAAQEAARIQKEQHSLPVFDVYPDPPEDEEPPPPWVRVDLVEVGWTACTACCNGTVVSDTCDECGERHCSECDPCMEALP